MAQKKEFEIRNGPSKWDLMLAFFDPQGTNPKASNRRIKLVIRVPNKGDYIGKVSVYGMHRIPVATEDSDGHDDLWEMEGFIDEVPHADIRHSEVEIQTYSTQHRTGSLIIIIR